MLEARDHRSDEADQPDESDEADQAGRPIPIRVFLVDDHDIVREGLTALLERERDVVVVGQAASAEEALDALPWLRADILIVDVRLPGMDGMELCRELAEHRFPGRVIVLSAFLDDESVYAAWLAGASAYIVKDVDADGLMRAIRSVARGGRVIDPKVAGTIVGWASRLELESSGVLSPTLHKVLRLLCRGQSNAQIAQASGLAVETVKKYLAQIYRRLEVQGRADAIFEARRRGLA